MSTIEIVILWCVVSYAIAMAVFIHKYAKSDRGELEPEDSNYVIFAPVVVPVAMIVVVTLGPSLIIAEYIRRRRLSKLRGKNENES